MASLRFKDFHNDQRAFLLEYHFMRQIVFILINSIALADNPLVLGIYAGAPVVNDTVAFELLSNEKAIVTSDYFNPDGSRNMKVKKSIKGAWEYKTPFLFITHGQFKDKLKIEDCPQPSPCFKFEKSEGKGLSPLNVPYGFGLRK